MFGCLLLLNLACVTLQEVSLTDDPALFPGHMEPLGTKQLRVEIETLQEYPSPQKFFTDFIKPGRPFLLKKGAINQAAYKLWDDNYLKSFPAADNEEVQVEPNHKEIREAQGFETSFSNFLNRYKSEEIYMVNQVPSFLQKDVEMPPPLRCNDTRKLMLNHVTWMSSGGTKSVIHTDDLDNINCLFRGSKELLFINPKYKEKVYFDRPSGGYSSIDVDKVNFTKFPAMREVEYTHCKMEEGDCLFIPFRWIHQVNSAANDNKQNIAVNIWFTHNPDHVPQQCEELPAENTSIDNWSFIGLDGYGQSNDTSLVEFLHKRLANTKHLRFNFRTFYELLHKLPSLYTEEDITGLNMPSSFLKLVKEMFDRLNIVEGQYVDEKDFQMIHEKDLVNDYEPWLEQQFDKMTNVIYQLTHRPEESSEKEPVEKSEKESEEASEESIHSEAKAEL